MPAQKPAQMTAEEFESRIVNWARSRTDIVALIQIGSRVQPSGVADKWSDWDYHLIVRNTDAYRKTEWLTEIAPCWSAYADRTERGVVKVSAIFYGGWEVDFVPIAAWQMKLVYWAMAHPRMNRLFPRLLQNGIANTQLVVAPGYRVVIGGAPWEIRLSALKIGWPQRSMPSRDFVAEVDGFWRHAVWVYKKIMRGENRAALRWMHRELAERRWTLLEQEARIAGRAARPEARMAEHWLGEQRLLQTAIETSTDQHVLAQALLAELSLFEEVSHNVASARGIELVDRSMVAVWMRTELRKLVG